MKLITLPARTGLAWVREGLRTYFKRPFVFTGLFFLITLLSGLIGSLPFVGVILTLVVWPFLSLGFMAVTKEVLEGRFPNPKLLFIGLTRDAATRMGMLQLGAFYALGFLAILAVSALFDGGQVAKTFLEMDLLDPNSGQLEEVAIVMWLTMALCVPLVAAFWHAPALLYWHGLSPVKSMLFSWSACWRNLGAFVLYFVAWLALIMVVLTAIMVVISLFAGGDTTKAFVLFTPLSLIAASMFFVSTYITYRDCFDSEPLTNGAPASLD